ncbi:MAG: hypothetical protein JW946_00305 [Candidatus Omnitrophica bacterium]|nr:hypothetical protein [Candidatus Omnitrophota bacterium]
MEKQKQQQIILLVLLVIFGLSLGYRFINSIMQKNSAVKITLPSAPAEKNTYPQIENEDIDIAVTEYNADNLSDPLKNKLYVYLADNISAIQKNTVLVQPPSISILGLVWDTSRPQAIIDGKILSVGEEVSGCRLLSVERDGVKVEYKGYEFFIKK